MKVILPSIGTIAVILIGAVSIGSYTISLGGRVVAVACIVAATMAIWKRN